MCSNSFIWNGYNQDNFYLLIDRYKASKEHKKYIDLNKENSSLADIFLTSSKINEVLTCSEQKNRMQYFSNEGQDKVNLVLHFIANLEKYNECRFNNMIIYNIDKQIKKGIFGNEVRDLYNLLDDSDKKTILYYVCQRKTSSDYDNYFLCCLKNLLDDVVFYSDYFENILYIFTTSKENENNNFQKLRLANILFKDILLQYKIEWETNPVILDENDYIIASENNDKLYHYIDTERI